MLVDRLLPAEAEASVVEVRVTMLSRALATATLTVAASELRRVGMAVVLVALADIGPASTTDSLLHPITRAASLTVAAATRVAAVML